MPNTLMNVMPEDAMNQEAEARADRHDEGGVPRPWPRERSRSELAPRARQIVEKKAAPDR